MFFMEKMSLYLKLVFVVFLTMSYQNRYIRYKRNANARLPLIESICNLNSYE